MLQRVKAMRDKDGGFTLIELLIVIVILGILAAIVVFAVGAITSRGANSACKADFKTVENAQETSRANGGAYQTSVQGLVDGEYLRSAPPGNIASASNGYFITTNNTGRVTVTNTQGTADAGDDTTSTDASNCPT